MSIKLSGKALVVQLGESEIRVASVTLGAKTPQITAGAVIPTPALAVEDGDIKNLDALREALTALRGQSEFAKARKVVFVLSSTQVISHVAAVPYMKNTKKLPQILEANADTYFPVDTADYCLTWKISGVQEDEGGKQTLVRLWAIPKSLLGRYYLLARDCGLSVAAIDYVGHGFARGIGADFVQPKAAQEDEGGVELYLNLEQEHILMSFVREGQVLMQRLLQRSDYSGSDLNDVFMELEYFRNEFPDCSLEQAVVSGGAAEDEAFLRELEDMVALPLQRLECEPEQIWCAALGASTTDLDFGDPALDAKGAKKVNLNANIPLQPVLLGAAVLVFGAALFVNLTGSKGWDAELQSLRDQQLTLNVQSAAVGGYADSYNQYAAEYAAYSSDWDHIFASVRTYNDNVGLILEELEAVLPKDAVVTELTMDEESMTVNTAFQEKEDVVYFLTALRGLQYGTIAHISDLQELSAQQAEAADPSALGSTSALEGMISSLLGGGMEAAPTEGSFEEAPTEGDNVVADLLANKAVIEMLIGGQSQEELLNSPLAEDLTYSQKMTLVKMKNKYDAGTLDLENLTEKEEDALRAVLAAVQGIEQEEEDSSSGSSSGTVVVPSEQEMETLLEKYDLTEQDLKDGLDNLNTAQFGVLDKHYVKLYDKYSHRALLKDGATLTQRKEALRSLLQYDPLAMHQFFVLVQEDMGRSGKSNALTQKIDPNYWLDASNRAMFYNSDQAMLDEKLPKLVDMLVKDESAVEATETLIKTNYNLTRKLAGHLAVAMGKERRYTSALDFGELQDDILAAKTKQDAELNSVVRSMLTPAGQAYYDTIKAGGTGSAGSSISDIIDQILNGTTGSTGEDVVLQEAAGNYGITVTLSYNDALIQAEQVRKGLDQSAKIADPVEVAG